MENGWKEEKKEKKGKEGRRRGRKERQERGINLAAACSCEEKAFQQKLEKRKPYPTEFLFSSRPICC